ncbi:MAG: aldehyde ferredoxin oxidoreductase C-terminal domain-containing protein [Dehalococcoidales bacterium]|nr:aldehyde ferredoxin oxidoreductase C-terminal domain-containing protein [Dehalococcoidales bacterium]
MGCWNCPAACKGSLKAGTGQYNYPAGNHRLEYETLGAFGANCGIVEVEPINMASHLCNAYGMDTISAGTIISFAMECYENGIISKADTDGIELTWGNGPAMVAMVEKIVKREGIGDVLADGVRIAAGRIGKGAEQFAVHAGGQELGMHDPRVAGHLFAGMPSGAMYWLNSTPGRHTQAFGPNSFMSHMNNAMGVCMIIFGWRTARGPYAQPVLNAVTGFNYTPEEVLKCGERIANMRHVFNLREGLNPLEHYIHPRIIGRPPQQEGPLAGVELDVEHEGWYYLGQLDWDRTTTVPSRKKLLELDMTDVADELWPPEKMPRMGPGG